MLVLILNVMMLLHICIYIDMFMLCCIIQEVDLAEGEVEEG